MKATKMSNGTLTMREFIAAQKKILACAADPRGTTITAFSVREVSAFTGLAQSTIYTYLRQQQASSIKMPTLARKNARVVPMDVFVKINRKIGTHRVLGKHVKVVRKTMEPTVDFLFDQLF